MIPSKTSFFNQVLNRLGETRISDPESNVEPKAIVLRELYQQSIDEVLREYPWSCAAAASTMAQPVMDNFTPYDYVYKLPLDCLRVGNLIDIAQGTYEKIEDEYRIMGKFLYTDYEEAGVSYTKQLTAPEDLDSHVAEACVLHLAARAAISITDDKSLEVSLESKYERALHRAKSSDGYERVNREVSNTKWAEIG